MPEGPLPEAAALRRFRKQQHPHTAGAAAAAQGIPRGRAGRVSGMAADSAAAVGAVASVAADVAM